MKLITTIFYVLTICVLINNGIIIDQSLEIGDWTIKSNQKQLVYAVGKYQLQRGFEIAVGIKESTSIITLLGGRESIMQKQGTEYDIENDVWNGLSQTFLPVGIYGGGEYYTQLNNKIYIIDPKNYGGDGRNKLSVYDLENKIFYDGYNGLHLLKPVGSGACITSSPSNFLYILGGYPSGIGMMNDVQILNLNNNQWMTSPLPPLMTSTRSELSCIYHPATDTIYAIGGRVADQMTGDSVEKLLVKDINIDHNEIWHELNDKLIIATKRSRAVKFANYIFVIGGEKVYGPASTQIHWLDQVSVVNVDNDEISDGGKLAFPSKLSAVIIVDNTIYSFGGTTTPAYNSWPTYYQYTKLKSIQPTQPTQPPIVDCNCTCLYDVAPELSPININMLDELSRTQSMVNLLYTLLTLCIIIIIISIITNLCLCQKSIANRIDNKLYKKVIVDDEAKSDMSDDEI